MPKIIKLKKRTHVANLLAQGKSIRDTAKLAGIATASVQKIKKELPELIQEKREIIQRRYLDEAVPSIEKMVELRDNAKSEQVQLQSATQLLDRADTNIGLQKPERAVLVFNFNGSSNQTKKDVINEVIDRTSPQEEQE